MATAAAASGSQQMLSPATESNINTKLTTNLKNRQRVNEYFRANVGTEEMLLRLAGVGGITFVTCAGTGAMIGGLAAGGKGALIGFGAGAGVALIIVCLYGGVKIRAHFNDWKASIADNCVIEEFRNIVTASEEFRDLWCPLTYEVFEDPIITGCGHTFEKNALYNHFNNNGTTCPLCQEPINEKQLSTNIVMIGKIKTAYLNITEKLLQDESQQYSLKVKSAFEALCKDMEVQVGEIFNEVSTKLTLDRLDGKVTVQEYVAEIERLKEAFNIKPIQK